MNGLENRKSKTTEEFNYFTKEFVDNLELKKICENFYRLEPKKKGKNE